MSQLPQAYKGERLGLPKDGPGSIATFGRRTVAFAVDAVLSGLVAGLFVAAISSHGGTSTLPRLWSFVPLTVDYLVGILVAGRTVGMNLLRIRLIRVDRDAAVTPWQILIRTILLYLLAPAVIVDRDGRGLHDRAVATAVVNA